MELVLAEFGISLGKSGERLVMKRKSGPPIEVPVEDVTGILVTGRGISVSSDAIEALVSHGASISFLTFGGTPYALLSTPNSLSKAALRREQLRSLEDLRSVQLSKALLHGKLRNQASNLLYFAKSRKDSAPSVHEQLHAMAANIGALLESMEALEASSATAAREALLNREARAAREYWGGVGLLMPEDLRYPGRVRKGARDPVNVALNYGYGILYSRLWNMVLQAGLDPYAGMLHADHEGRPTLVFDYVEPYRPYAVDRPILAMFTKRWRPGLEGDALDAASRKELSSRVMDQFEASVEYQGKTFRLADVMQMGAYAIAATLRNEGLYEPFVADW